MPKPKATTELVAARAAVDTKMRELAAAKEAVTRRETELAAAIEALRQAQVEADSIYTQCRMVDLSWSTGKEIGSRPMVILRQTPAGILVVRQPGQLNADERKFKWSVRSESWQDTEKPLTSISDPRELRDVPKSYIPVRKS